MLFHNFEFIDPIRSQICSCHDSSAVVSCASLWPDMTIIYYLRMTLIFKRLNHDLMYPLWNGYTIDVPPNGLEPLPNFGRFTGALAQAAGGHIVSPHLDVWVKSVPRAQHLPTKDLVSSGPLWCQTITMYNVKVMVLFFSRNFTIFPQNDIFPILVFHIRVNVKMNDISLYACIET